MLAALLPSVKVFGTVHTNTHTLYGTGVEVSGLLMSAAFFGVVVRPLSVF